MAFDVFYVQVRDKETGAEYPIPVDRYDSKLFVRLDEPPVDPQTGSTLTSKPKTSVAREATKKAAPKTGQSAAPSKEKS